MDKRTSLLVGGFGALIIIGYIVLTVADKDPNVFLFAVGGPIAAAVASLMAAVNSKQAKAIAEDARSEAAGARTEAAETRAVVTEQTNGLLSGPVNDVQRDVAAIREAVAPQHEDESDDAPGTGGRVSS